MKFTKMQGLGNDFVVVDGEVAVTPDLVRRVCDRRFGAGADGLLQVSVDDIGVVMGYWNADGSRAEMCGNGLRCAARRSWDVGAVSDRRFLVQTDVGRKRVHVRNDGLVAVDLGPVRVLEAVEIDGIAYRRVDVGNPHAVTETDPDSLDIDVAGRSLQSDPAFPAGVNVEFFTWTAPGRVTMRVWERGVGETLACGTGMVAVAAIARERDPVGSPIVVEVPGGTAEVAFDDGVWLIGPAVTVYEGSWII